MKDYVAGLVRAAPNPLEARNEVREYLQARILGVLQRRGAMVPLAFQGGTALRFLYATARYSEDLDFSLERDRGEYDFRGYLTAIERELVVEGYDVTFEVRDARTVNSAFIRFPGLLYEIGLSSDSRETIAVRVEVDTRPPEGAVLATTVVRRYVMLQLQHYDRASLLAGKLHAVLQRPFMKGRDVYDLAWYLADPTWPEPNLLLLNNALRQTEWSGPELDEGSWRGAVRDRLEAVSWEQVSADVAPFLGPGADPGILTRENLMRLIDRKDVKR